MKTALKPDASASNQRLNSKPQDPKRMRNNRSLQPATREDNSEHSQQEQY